MPIGKFLKRMHRYNATYFRHKVYDSVIRKTVEATIDSMRLHRFHPDFVELHIGRKDECRDRIFPYYDEYIHRVSSEIMTVSLELCLFLLTLCEFQQPKRILDLGSGFSSFLFRFYAAGADPEPEVWSVDDSAEWLEKTRSYLAGHDLSVANLLTWDALIARDAGRFDLVLYDLGGFDFRKNSFPRVLEFAGEKAFLVVDDMHAAEFGRHVIRHLRKTGLPYFSAWTYTNDRYGRYSLLAQCDAREGRG
ncbi:MAG TPA: hypothetical protein DEH27_04710 [Deltaproteobacteria bacterium]|nr:hypothetical protein [Deltaproteobacteria bacterium]